LVGGRIESERRPSRSDPRRPPHWYVAATPVREALLTLHAVADEACAGLAGTAIPVAGSFEARTPFEIFSDQDYGRIDLRELELNPYGYRWIRLRQITTA
jgi:hypothetical protein